jgi:hypothetical protein
VGRVEIQPAPAWSALAGSILAGLVLSAAPAGADHPSSKVAALVRQGLQAEIDGNPALRSKSLSSALELAPDHAPARWANGYIEDDGEWVRFDDVRPDAKHAEILEEYQRIRGTYADRADAQLELADWCHRRDLKDQERAHLQRSLDLNANQPALRTRLGLTYVDGAWLTPREVRDAKQRGKRAVDDLKHWTPRCEKLRAALNRPAPRQRELALEQIRALRDPSAIIAMETILAPSGEDAGLAVVDTLAEMHVPEASIALARLAALSDSPDVVDAATEKLKSQPAHNYIPAMLVSLVAPEGVQTTIVRGPNGGMLFRQAFLHEGADRKSLVVFDDVYQGLAGIWGSRGGDTQLQAGQLGAAVVSQRARAVDAFDRRFERQNERICKTLRDVTGQRLTANPADWWKWWDDYNEMVQEGSKPVETTYVFEATPLITGAPRIMPSCLVAGTPIWTDRGPVAVEKMHIGDRVLAEDPISGELAYKLVLRTTVREVSEVIRVNLPGDQIVASGGHPFWVAGSGWVHARHLEPGMLLHGVAGAIAIESVKIDDSANQTVYNLVVEDAHDYFAGKSRLLLHDTTPREPTRGPLPGLEETTKPKAENPKIKAARTKS